MEMATVQEVELLIRQLEELNARMEEIQQQSANAAMKAAVTGLRDAVRTMGQSVTRPRPEDMRVGKPEPYMPGRDQNVREQQRATEWIKHGESSTRFPRRY